MSRVRKYSSTAFFSHSLTFQPPLPSGSATRNSPLSMPSITRSTDGRVAQSISSGVSTVRRSHALSMWNFSSSMPGPSGFCCGWWSSSRRPCGGSSVLSVKCGQQRRAQRLRCVSSSAASRSSVIWKTSSARAPKVAMRASCTRRRCARKTWVTSASRPGRSVQTRLSKVRRPSGGVGETDLRRDAEMAQVPRLGAARGLDRVEVGDRERGAEAALDFGGGDGALAIGRQHFEGVEHVAVRAVEQARLLDRQARSGRAWRRSRRTGRRGRANARTLPAHRCAPRLRAERARADARGARLAAAQHGGLPCDLVGTAAQEAFVRHRGEQALGFGGVDAEAGEQLRARRARVSAMRSAAATGCSRPRRNARRVAVYRSASSRSFHAFHNFGEVPAMSAQVSRYSRSRRSRSATCVAKRWMTSGSQMSCFCAVTDISRCLRTSHATSSVSASHRPCATAELARIDRAEFGMIAAPPLGDVVEQAGEQQQFRLAQARTHFMRDREAFVGARPRRNRRCCAAPRACAGRR